MTAVGRTRRANTTPVVTDESKFVKELEAKGGKYWIGQNSARVYFEMTADDYAALVARMRAEAGGSLSVWPEKQIGYVVVETREFVSTRRGVSSADFKKSLNF